MDITEIKQAIDIFEEPLPIPHPTLEQKMASEAMQAIRVGMQQALKKNDLELAEQILKLGKGSKLVTDQNRNQELLSLQSMLQAAQQQLSVPTLTSNLVRLSEQLDQLEIKVGESTRRLSKSQRFTNVALPILVTLVAVMSVLAIFQMIANSSNPEQATPSASPTLATNGTPDPAPPTDSATNLEEEIATAVMATIEAWPTSTPEVIIYTEIITATAEPILIEPIEITVAPNYTEAFTFVYALTWPFDSPLATLETDQPSRITLFLNDIPANDYFKLEDNGVWPIVGKVITYTEPTTMTLYATVIDIPQVRVPVAEFVLSPFLSAASGQTSSGMRNTSEEKCEQPPGPLPQQGSVFKVLGQIKTWSLPQGQTTYTPIDGYLVQQENEQPKCLTIMAFDIELNDTILLPDFSTEDENQRVPFPKFDTE